MTLTRPCGVIPSLRRVKPFMSQNITVITRRWPSAAVSVGRLIKPSTTRGSIYLPKVSLTRWFSRSCTTIRLNAAASCPISSLVVTSMARSRWPASTARVPSSNCRTDRMMPPLTRLAKIMPTTAARAVAIAEITRILVCSDLIVAMAP